MSGSLFAPWAIARYPRDAAVGVARFLGCRTHGVDEELLDCLRSRDVGDILQAFSRHQQVFLMRLSILLKRVLTLKY